jgi:hypothetical protein
MRARGHSAGSVVESVGRIGAKAVARTTSLAVFVRASCLLSAPNMFDPLFASVGPVSTAVVLGLLLLFAATFVATVATGARA